MNVYGISRIDFKIWTTNPIKKTDIRIIASKKQGHIFVSDTTSFFDSFCLKGILKFLHRQEHSSIDIIFFIKIFKGPNKKAYIKKNPVARLDTLNRKNDMAWNFEKEDSTSVTRYIPSETRIPIVSHFIHECP